MAKGEAMRGSGLLCPLFCHLGHASKSEMSPGSVGLLALCSPFAVAYGTAPTVEAHQKSSDLRVIPLTLGQDSRSSLIHQRLQV